MQRLEAAPDPWLAMVYSDPIRYVEEIAIVEGRQNLWRFSGWYDKADPTRFVLLRKGPHGDLSVYLYAGQQTAWCLQQLPFSKFYLQTDTAGALAAASMFPVALKGTVRYFCVSESKANKIRFTPLDIVDVEWMIEENTGETGQLRGVECRGVLNERPITSASTPFLCSKSAMIGVQTAEQYRGQGLGRHAVALLVRYLLKRKISPVYAADIKNVPSRKIAETLFEPYFDFSFLYVGDWELRRPPGTPKELPDSLFLF